MAESFGPDECEAKSIWEQHVLERQRMTRARKDGLTLLLLGCVVFVLLGSTLESLSTVSMTDLRTYYYSARCMLQKSDPYSSAEVMRVYHAEEKERPVDSLKNQLVITRYIYLPPAFAFTAPIALLPFEICKVLWMFLNASCLILAAYLTWDLAAAYSPILSGALIGFLMANSELVLVTGNVVGVAIGLCLVGVWCVVKQRHELIGVACFAVSLILKPHDSGLVWLFFLLAGGAYRKRALQTLGVTALISLATLLWVNSIAPHWTHELRSNMAELSVHGGVTDPGPSSSGAHALAMQINLQTAVSMFRDQPSFYNPICYLICGVVLLFWCVKVVRSKPSEKVTWIAFASVVSLTMLPVYHRQADAKLLLLTIPACAMLWAAKGRMANLALAVVAGGVIFTAEIPWAIVLETLKHLRLPNSEFSRILVIALQVLPIPAMLLVESIFFLCLSWKNQIRAATSKL